MKLISKPLNWTFYVFHHICMKKRYIQQILNGWYWAWLSSITHGGDIISRGWIRQILYKWHVICIALAQNELMQCYKLQFKSYF